mmetsp:Transcript_15994/g.15400  ORF Transcript_15994/g.15400 Transcript_15994/m.15400 type:complete len:174 (-) Transcript_15994:1483-2004(-)
MFTFYWPSTLHDEVLGAFVRVLAILRRDPNFYLLHLEILLRNGSSFDISGVVPYWGPVLPDQILPASVTCRSHHLHGLLPLPDLDVIYQIVDIHDQVVHQLLQVDCYSFINGLYKEHLDHLLVDRFRLFLNILQLKSIRDQVLLSVLTQLYVLFCHWFLVVWSELGVTLLKGL